MSLVSYTVLSCVLHSFGGCGGVFVSTRFSHSGLNRDGGKAHLCHGNSCVVVSRRAFVYIRRCPFVVLSCVDVIFLTRTLEWQTLDREWRHCGLVRAMCLQKLGQDQSDRLVEALGRFSNQKQLIEGSVGTSECTD